MYKDSFSIVNRVHNILAEYIFPGDVVVDGTAGQGYDTLFLAGLVGKKGKVWAFDIQETACQITRERLKAENIDWVEVICENHIRIKDYVNEPIAAAVFNLGYLPGQDHKIITNGENTIKAIENVMELLKSNGILIVVCYLGHPGGMEEYQQIRAYLQYLSAKEWCVCQFSLVNKKNAPIILTVQK